jgi:hypothetical protein
MRARDFPKKSEVLELPWEPSYGDRLEFDSEFLGNQFIRLLSMNHDLPSQGCQAAGQNNGITLHSTTGAEVIVIDVNRICHQYRPVFANYLAVALFFFLPVF